MKEPFPIKTIFNSALCLISITIVLVIIIIITPVVYLYTVTLDRNKQLYLFLTRFFVRMFFALSFVPLGKMCDTSNIPQPKKGVPRIYVLTHASLIDGLLLFLLPGQVKFMANEFYARIPIFGLGMSTTGNIAVSRTKDGAPLDIYYHALEILDAGYPLVIFPEGTRTRTGKIGRLQNSAFMLALEKHAEIVPVVLDTWNFMRPGERWVRDRAFSVLPLTPLSYEEYCGVNYKTLSQIVKARLLEGLLTLRDTKRSNKKYYRHLPHHTALDNEMREELAALRVSTESLPQQVQMQEPSQVPGGSV